MALIDASVPDDTMRTISMQGISCVINSASCVSSSVGAPNVAPRAIVVGVEVEASSPFTIGFEAGCITTIRPGPSIADGLTGNLEPGSTTFPLVKQVVDVIVTVSEDDVMRAMRGLATEEHLMVEGAGAVATAAVIAGKAAVPGQRVVVLVTGSNVDLPTWWAAVGAGPA